MTVNKDHTKHPVGNLLAWRRRRTMNKLHTYLALLVISAFLLPACSAFTTDAPDCKKAEVFCVGLVTEIGKISDKSINQSAWEGVLQAKNDLGAVVDYIETTDTKDYEKNITTFAEAGYDVIVTVGFGQGQVTAKVAATYPTLKFIGADQYQDPGLPSPANLTSLAFHEDRAGFLAGALAASMTKTKKLGAVCATDANPAVWRYCEGFKAGSAYINPEMEVTLVYHNDAPSGKAFTDPEWGAGSASTLIKNGVDVVFGVGEKTGSGAVIAAAQMGMYAIGADDDQYNALPEAQNMLLSSAIKLIASGVFDLIKLIREDKFPGSNYYGSVTYAPFHDLDKAVPVDVKDAMIKIAQGLADGTIKTNVENVKP
jgi:basic membrane protein A